MTTNKPEIAGYRWKTDIPDAIGGGYAYSYASHWSTGPREAEKLIRLSDYEALQAECERLRKDALRFRFEHQNPDAMFEIELKAIKGNAVDIGWYRDAIDSAMQGDQP